jgi:hypothetical protein
LHYGWFSPGGDLRGQVHKGTKPADLLIYQSIKFELVINLKTAKAQAIDWPFLVGGVAEVLLKLP